MRLPLLALALATLAGGVATADKARIEQIRFRGVHPLPEAEGGGICYIEGPHVHIFHHDDVQYRVHDGWAVFVGDPVAFGYEGPKVAFQGAHPIEVEGTTEYCYLEGPHFHIHAPVAGPAFQVKGGAYVYVGAPVPRVEAYARINAIYAPLVYVRPPAVVIEAPAVVVRTPAVIVTPPHVDIGVNIGVGIGIGAGVKVKHDNGLHRGHHK